MRFFRFFRVGTVSIFGAPVYVHASVFILCAIIVVSAVNAPISAFLALMSYLGIILIHEFGHAFVAHKLGLFVERIDIGLIHGKCYYQRPNFEWHEILVSWGGVLAQLSVAIVVLSIGATGLLESSDYFGPILVFLGIINFVIAAVNSLPGPGADGSTMWRIIPVWLSVRQQRQNKKKRKTRFTVVPKDK